MLAQRGSRRRHVSLLLVSGLLGSAVLASAPSAASGGAPDVSLRFIGRFDSGSGVAGAEISAFDPASQRLFVTNGAENALDIVDASNPAAPSLVERVALLRPLQSVAVRDGVVAVAIEGTTRQSPGEVVVLDTDGVIQWRVNVGALPDMVTFTPDGTKIVTADEGEPEGYCAGQVDPEGSVSVIDVATRSVAIARFNAVGSADALRAKGVRIIGPGATTVAQDIEPEYVAISHDSRTAWVTLQENNAMATIDLRTATVTNVVGLGYQRHGGVGGVAIDTSSDDGGPNIVTRNAALAGMYMPDAVAGFRVRGQQFLAMANEGDAREYCGVLGGTVLEREDLRAGSGSGSLLSPDVFSSTDRSNAQLGRLRVSTLFPATKNAAGKLNEAYSYGSRSFTIRDTTGKIVFDSGDQFEQRTKALPPVRFNAEWNLDADAAGPADGRSPAKGPEPEGIAVGRAYGRQLAFVSLERTGGVMVYDVTDPANSTFVKYLNTTDYTGTIADGTAGDVSPEGVVFVTGDDSPTGKPLVIVTYELSGTTAIFQVDGPGRDA